ncbi:hypothetical protein [Actinotignum timonense]|uniref:hypothetical protein n=1 Tax=Actinotignum timonense TaxID=1870995 RepID=UPI002A81051E|nr:hypothetical protein [Actinotignum timonense]
MRFLLEELAARHPGHAVEIRVPYVGACGGGTCGGAHHYDDDATGHGCSGHCSAGHSFAGIPSAAQVAQDVIDDARRGEQTGLAVVAGLSVAALGAVTLLGSALFGRGRRRK